MGRIFDLDSPLMRALSKMADLLWLNLLTLLLCIPIVTAGAALTALNFCCLKMVRGEEGYITKDYFRSFKENFGQSTILWIIILLVGGVLAFDVKFLFFSELASDPSTIIVAGILVACILYIFTLLYIFPVQSHFVNSVGKTLRNSFLMSIMALPRSVLMLIVWCIPTVVMYYFQTLFLLGLLFWFSLPAYISALLYNKTFKKFEPEKEDTNDDFTWSVESDLEGTEEETSEEIKEIVAETDSVDGE